MRTARWIILGLFLALLGFLALVEERRLTRLSYRRGRLLERLRSLEEERRELGALLEKTVNPAALERAAGRLGMDAPAGRGR